MTGQEPALDCLGALYGSQKKKMELACLMTLGLPCHKTRPPQSRSILRLSSLRRPLQHFTSLQKSSGLELQTSQARLLHCSSEGAQITFVLRRNTSRASQVIRKAYVEGIMVSRYRPLVLCCASRTCRSHDKDVSTF